MPHNPRPRTDTADTHMADWIQLVRAEYLEMPGLSLTKWQLQRLCSLDPVTTEAVLAALVDAKCLRRTDRGAFVRVDGG